MTGEYQMKQIDAIDQLFHKMGDDGDLILLLAKVVDDF